MGSDWCSKSLKSFLQKAFVQSDGCNGSIKVDDLGGEASVAFVSGKKRYVFDYHAKLNYDIIDDEEDILASGSLRLQDISSTAISDELEVEIFKWVKAPSVECVEQVMKCRGELVNEVRSQVLLFVKAFNMQY